MNLSLYLGGTGLAYLLMRGCVAEGTSLGGMLLADSLLAPFSAPEHWHITPAHISVLAALYLAEQVGCTHDDLLYDHILTRHWLLLRQSVVRLLNAWVLGVWLGHHLLLLGEHGL